MKELFYDIIIVGGGATGLRTALEIQKKGDASCAVFSKSHPFRSQSVMAQGGMNAALNRNQDKGEDTIDHHINDTYKSGNEHGDKKVISYFCEKAPDIVIELEHEGMLFSRKENGEIDQRPFGGMSYPRTCYAKDFTGRGLMQTLIGQLFKYDVPIYDDYFLVSLLKKEGQIYGGVFIDFKEGELVVVKGKAVVLATGGAGQIYEETVNSFLCTGDGMAIAKNTGVNLKDMEFVQFHPTMLAERPFLISEAVRGEGGHLLNKKLERFMHLYDAERLELAPRNIVSKAILDEIKKEGEDDGHVFIDLRHIDDSVIKHKLAHIYKKVMEYTGIDITKELIPVKPTAHYFMGGIEVDAECKTSVKGLFAAGECSCIGLHGANRVGGNSLMETQVFGKLCADKALEYIESYKTIEGEFESENLLQEIKELTQNKGENPFVLHEKLKNIMQECAFIMRTSECLKNALERLEDLEKEIDDVSIPSSNLKYNSALQKYFELKNMMIVANEVVIAAQKRQSSKGSHYIN